MNALLTLLAAQGAIAGSELLFWLVVILVVLGIIYFIRRIL
jgi:hypothetical protein